MGPASQALADAHDRIAEARAALADAQAARDYAGITHNQHVINRIGEELNELISPAGQEQLEERRKSWTRLETEVVAEYGAISNDLLDCVERAEAAVLAVADAASALSELVDQHRRDGRRPDLLNPYGSQLLRAADGTALHSVDPAACVLSVAAVGLTAGNAARAWPQVLDQCLQIRKTLVLPERSTRTVEETTP